MGNLNLKKITIVVVATLSITGCSNWGGYAGAGAGALGGNLIGRAVGINPYAAGVAGAIGGGLLGDKLVNDSRYKQLSPGINENMMKLAKNADDAFAAVTTASNVADDAELAYQSSPTPETRTIYINAAKVERVDWDLYKVHREQLSQSVVTAKLQNYEVSGFYEHAKDLSKRDDLLFAKISERENRMVKQRLLVLY